MTEYICIYDDDDMQYIPSPYDDKTVLTRCKDCKHCVHEVYENLTVYGFYNESHCFFCEKHFDEELGEFREVMIDDYCSWAERREE